MECLHCSKVFESISGRAKYCSDACKQESYRNRSIVTEPIVTDPVVTIDLSDCQHVRQANVRGVNPDLVPELSEFKNAEPFAFTSITVSPQKFGMLIGISREMIEDNEVGLVGYRTREAGRSHRELQRREHMKCIGFFSTGPAVATGVVGSRNHGAFYTKGGYSNVLSATALTWEEIISRSETTLISQQITVGDMTVDFPVVPNAIIANPHHMNAIQKVLNASITVVATGVGQPGGAGANVAGTNIFRGRLPVQIFDNNIPTGQALIGLAGRGLVTVRRTNLEVETHENFRFDADDLKTRERFLPAVIEDRYWCDVQMSG